jgi:hypothetical protein
LPEKGLDVSPKAQPSPDRPLSKTDQKERNIDLAMAQYRAEQDAMRSRMAKQRELRLAQEARTSATAPAPQKKARAKRAAPRPSRGRNLAEWLEQRQKAGRES